MHLCVRVHLTAHGTANGPAAAAAHYTLKHLPYLTIPIATSTGTGHRIHRHRHHFRRGMYGAPFFAITDHNIASQPEEMIAFGSDRFEQIAFALDKPWFGPDPSRPSTAKL